MAGNSRGERLQISTFGESHGAGLGVIIDGCPAGHPFPRAAMEAQLARRKPGQNRLTTQRKEGDAFELLSGVDPRTERTLGTPIALLVRNADAKSNHYDDIAQAYRPSHADYTYDARYGLRAVAGGGRSSARETVARVAAGALAEDLLRTLFGIEIVAWVDSVADVAAPQPDLDTIDRAQVDASEVRCPIPDQSAAMVARIEEARKAGDSVGGTVRCIARGVPAGWGEPVFAKLTAELAGAMLSLPASRGFEIGEGFAATAMRGSEHNDAFESRDGAIRTRSNRSGGIQGGISNGEHIRIRVGFKPVATIFKEQDTVTPDGQPAVLKPRKGRHDPCVVARAVPMVEAEMALVLCDQMLRRQGIRVQDLQR